jgi:hypothetical protein
MLESLAALGWTPEAASPQTGCAHTNLVGRRAENFADFAGQALQGERLLQKSFLGFGGG